MQNKVVVASSVNLPEEAAKRANAMLAELGDGWAIVSAITTTTVFGVDESGHDMPPIHHAVYATTIALEKPD